MYPLWDHMLTHTLGNTICKRACKDCATLSVFSSARRQPLALHGRATCHEKPVHSHSCSAGRCTMLTTSASLRVAMARNALGTEGCCQHAQRTPCQCNLLDCAGASIAKQPLRQSARSARPRNIAFARLVNDWPTLRGARRVQTLVAFSCPLPMTRIRASAVPRICVRPRLAHSHNARSHLERRVLKTAASRR